jgi:hypothetical protein
MSQDPATGIEDQKGMLTHGEVMIPACTVCDPRLKRTRRCWSQKTRLIDDLLTIKLSLSDHCHGRIPSWLFVQTMGLVRLTSRFSTSRYRIDVPGVGKLYALSLPTL